MQRGQNGLTLVEVIVALLIFAVAIGGMCGLIMCAKQLSDQSRSHYTAINIAKNRLEKIRAIGFDQALMFRENNVVIDEKGNPDTDGYFRRSTTVSGVSSNLCEVVITVQLRDRVSLQFGNDAETLRSYLADYVLPTQ